MNWKGSPVKLDLVGKNQLNGIMKENIIKHDEKPHLNWRKKELFAAD